MACTCHFPIPCANSPIPTTLASARSLASLAIALHTPPKPVLHRPVPHPQHNYTSSTRMISIASWPRPPAWPASALSRTAVLDLAWPLEGHHQPSLPTPPTRFAAACHPVSAAPQLPRAAAAGTGAGQVARARLAAPIHRSQIDSTPRSTARPFPESSSTDLSAIVAKDPPNQLALQACPAAAPGRRLRHGTCLAIEAHLDPTAPLGIAPSSRECALRDINCHK